MSRNQNDDMALITVPVPPQRLRWLASEMDASGIPYRIQQDPRSQAYNVQTYQMAQPILEQVLGAVAGWDLLARQPRSRSRGTDALGFGLTTSLMGFTVYAAVQIGAAAAAAGLPGDAASFTAVLVLGLVLTAVLNIVTHSDPRRWLLVLGVWLGLAAAMLWFGSRAMGVL